MIDCQIFRKIYMSLLAYLMFYNIYCEYYFKSLLIIVKLKISWLISYYLLVAGYQLWSVIVFFVKPIVCFSIKFIIVNQISTISISISLAKTFNSFLHTNHGKYSDVFEINKIFKPNLSRKGLN